MEVEGGPVRVDGQMMTDTTGTYPGNLGLGVPHIGCVPVTFAIEEIEVFEHDEDGIDKCGSFRCECIHGIQR